MTAENRVLIRNFRYAVRLRPCREKRIYERRWRALAALGEGWGAKGGIWNDSLSLLAVLGEFPSFPGKAEIEARLRTLAHGRSRRVFFRLKTAVTLRLAGLRLALINRCRRLTGRKAQHESEREFLGSVRSK